MTRQRRHIRHSKYGRSFIAGRRYTISPTGKRYEVIILRKREDPLMIDWNSKSIAKRFARTMSAKFPKENIWIYDHKEKKEVKW